MTRHKHQPAATAPTQGFSASAAYSEDSSSIFDEDLRQNYVPFDIGERHYEAAAFGWDNRLPYRIIDAVGRNMVMAQNKLFNALTCYAAGPRLTDRETGKPVLEEWTMRNQLSRYFMEQCMDMKYFYFTVSVIILSRNGRQIVQLRHKEACYCRFERADKKGRIAHVFYADWRKTNGREVEAIELLDQDDPLGDLRVRMGQDPDPATGTPRRQTATRKFAIVTRFPTPGFAYYPVPFYAAIFRDAWYDIYGLIGQGKRAKIRNSAPPRFVVEVHRDYWDNLCDQEGIVDPVRRADRIRKEKENIEKFLTGSKNIGKTWVTGYYIDPATGKEISMVRINNVANNAKEGGDWADDVQEAANSICYGDNVHPNLVGATPGKSAMNNSGSDKRELFTLKQATETAFHDIMKLPILTVLHYNGWAKNTTLDIPILQLTTLDEHKDASLTTTDNPQTL